MKTDLSKWDILLIRACKSNAGQDNIIRRLQKIWRLRCGLPENYEIRSVDIFHGLIDILESRKSKISTDAWLEIITRSDPNKFFAMTASQYSYWTNLLMGAAYKIRFTAVAEWPNFISSKRFK